VKELENGLIEKPSHGKSGDFFYHLKAGPEGSTILLKSVEVVTTKT